MKVLMYAARDSAVEAFLQPMGFRSDGEAVRSFCEAVGAAGTPFCRHPHHFAWYFLGTFDDTSGVFDSTPGGPRMSCTGLQARSMNSATEVYPSDGDRE